MDINSPIKYKFPYRWNSENMAGTPTVNRLLKALIERDYRQAEFLLTQGANFKKIDNETFRRCLFEFVEDYELMEFMIENGLNHIYFYSYPSISYSRDTECIDRAGYGWSLTGRAYDLGLFDVLDLLFENRFEPGLFRRGSYYYFIDVNAMRTNDIEVIDILLSHGYPKQKLLNAIYADERYNNKAYWYVANDPDIDWYSYGLGKLENEIPVPQEPTFSFFTFKNTKERRLADYRRKIANYKKEVAAKKEYISTMSQSDLKAYYKNLEKDPKLEAAFEAVIKDILEERRQEVLRQMDFEIEGNKSTYSSPINPDNNYSAVYESYEDDLRETKINQFSFVDGAGNYRRWGDDFVDGAGNYVRWGETFVDGAGNYVRWGETFVDGAGNYVRWGDDFVDGEGNFVHFP